MGKKSGQTMPTDVDIADAHAPECRERKTRQQQQATEKTEFPKDLLPVSRLLVTSRRVWGYLTAPY